MRTKQAALALVLTAWMLPAFAWQAEDAKKPATAEKKTEASSPGKSTANISSKPAAETDPDYVIGVEDVLAINVWREPDMSRVVVVRQDGKITLPLLGEFEADGQTPKKLEEVILKKLQTLVTNPDVSVIVQEIRSQKFNVMGEVMKPGTYPISGDTTVLDAIAMAGGFKEFARPKKMYILRKQKTGSPVRIAVNYEKVIKGEAPEQNIKLETRDTLVVP